MSRDYNFGVYIVTNRNHSVLYIGVTNSLSRRTQEHREGTGANFPAAYRCSKLIYYEQYSDVRDAIARESQLKKWSRIKKINLINSRNPSWLDLGADILDDD
jgi:putative endonuclease